MLYEKVLKNAIYVLETGIVDYLSDNGVNIEFSSTSSMEACLFIKGRKLNIIIRNVLSYVRVKFGYSSRNRTLQADVENGFYSFSLELNKSRREFKANLFACFCLLIDVDLMDFNVIQYLINKGYSQGIAVKVFEYMQQNMKDVYMVY